MKKESRKTRNHLNPFLVALFLLLFFGVPVTIHSQEPKPNASVDKLTTKDFEPQKKPAKRKPQRNTKPKVPPPNPASAPSDPVALYESGQYFYEKKDYQEAMRLFLKAAEQGNTDAQSAIGWMYQKGFGVKKDSEEAKKWFLKASQQTPSQTDKPEAVKPETAKLEPPPQVQATKVPPPAPAGAWPQESSYASIPPTPQARDTLMSIQPFLGEWKGEWEIATGSASTLGEQPCRLVVYIEKDQGYVDYYVGSVRSSQKSYMSTIGNVFGIDQQLNKLKAEVIDVNGSACLVFNTSTDKHNWFIRNEKLHSERTIGIANAKGTLSKVK